MRRRAASPTSKRPSPKLVLLLGADEVAGRPLQGRVQGLYRPPRRQRRARRPTWSCRARPMPKSTAPTSTPRAGCSAARRAAFAPGEAREDWTILRAVSELARQAAAVRQLRPAARGDGRRRSRSSAATGLIDLPWSPPKLDAKAEGPVALSDPRLLPDQRHLPRQPDHAALLGRAGPRPSSSRRRRNDRDSSSHWGMSYDWAWFIATIIGILVIALPLMLAVAMIIYAERKIWAAIALRRGPERGRAVGPAAELRRRAEGLPQGNHHPDQRQQGPVPDRADHHLHRRADRLGGGAVRRRRGARRHQCRPALHPRGELARRLRRDHRRLGVQLQISVLLGASRRRADGQLRSVDRLRPDLRRALRRHLQPDRASSWRRRAYRLRPPQRLTASTRCCSRWRWCS